MLRRKISKSLPPIVATLQVQFRHYFDNFESSLLHVVDLSDSPLLVQHFLSEIEGQLWDTRSVALRVQVMSNVSSLWVFGTETAPEQPSTNRQQIWMYLRIIFFFNNIFSSSMRGDHPEPAIQWLVRNTRSFCCRRATLNISFV